MLNHPYQTPGTNESFGGKKTWRKCSRFFCMLMNLEGRSRSEGPRRELDLDQITLGLRFISIQKNLEHFLLVFFPPNCLRAKALRTIWLKSFSVWRPRMISGRMTQVPSLRPGAFLVRLEFEIKLEPLLLSCPATPAPLRFFNLDLC